MTSQAPTPTQGQSTSSKHFALSPKTIEFTGVKADNIYFMVLTLQNVSNKRRAIKVLPPQTDQFSMELSTVHTEISPGLSLKLKVYHQTPPAPEQESTDSDEEYAEKLKTYASQSWHDRLIVISGEDQQQEQFVIPLHAWGRKSDIQFNSFINFGTIQSNGASTQLLSLRNVSAFTGAYRIEFDKSVPVTIHPSSGTVAPRGEQGSELQIRCEISPNELPLGPYRALGRMYLDDATTPLLLDLNANIVEASLQLMWPTISTGNTIDLNNLTAAQLEKVQDVYFGSIYFGETRKIDAILLNNSPAALNFLVHLSDARDEKIGGSLSSGSSPRGGGGGYDTDRNADDGRVSIAGSVLGDHDLDGQGHEESSKQLGTSKVIHTPTYYRPDVLVSPMEGRLEPYGSIKLTFIFQPLQPRHLKKEMASGFKSLVQGGPEHETVEPPFVKYNALCKIDSLDGKYRTTVPVGGHANVPCAQLSSDIFDFGSCPVHSHVDHFLTLKNSSSALPLAYEFSRIAGFNATPSFGSLGPRSSTRIRLTFQPKNLGSIKNRRMDLALLGTPAGKQPSYRTPVEHASKGSLKEREKKNDAVAIYPLLLSGTAETIGLNKTLTLTTGGLTKQVKDFAKPIVLARTAKEDTEQKELAALGSGEADVAEVDGELQVFHGVSSGHPTSLPAGAKKPFKRVTGWNDPELSNKYTGRYEVTKGSLDNRVTFTPDELHKRTENQKYYASFLKHSRIDRDPSNHPQPAILEKHVTSAQGLDSAELPMDEKGMGMPFAAGLREPTTQLPQPAEKLKLKYSMAGFEGEGRKRLAKKTADGPVEAFEDSSEHARREA